MREWRNWQTRTVQVRVPERAWGFNSPLAHKLSPRNHHGSGGFRIPTPSADFVKLPATSSRQLTTSAVS